MPAQPGDTARLVRTLVIAVLGNSVLGASRMAVPLVALAMGASEFTVGTLAALVMVVPVLTTVPFGRWMDRVGALTPMKVAITLTILSGFVVALRAGIPTLVLSSVLTGAGAIFSHVASVKAVGSVADPDWRTRRLGYLAVSYSAMQFVSPLMVGFAYDHAGARGAFSAIGSLPLGALVLLFLGGHLFMPQAAAPAARPEATGDRLSLLGDPRLRRWSLIYAVLQAALTLFPVVVALHGARLGIGASGISAILAAQAVGAVASRVAISLLKSVAIRSLLVGVALIVSACAYAIVPLLHTWVPLAAVAVCLGAATGLGQPVSLAMVYEAAPRERVNEAISVASITANLLQLVTPFVSGALAAVYGVATMTTIIALSLLAAAALGLSRARG